MMWIGLGLMVLAALMAIGLIGATISDHMDKTRRPTRHG